MSPEDRDRLRFGAAELGMQLSDRQLHQFARYGEMLEEWNRKLNLTRIPPEDYVSLHYLDSLAAAAAHDFARSKSLIDVGAGAGFPGVPLKIAFPALRVTLLDSTRKRLDFIDRVLDDLGLEHAHVVHMRAEQAARTPLHREQYDIAVARAVARMEVLAEWLLPFVRVGGVVLALKSHGVEDEVTKSAGIVAALGGGKPIIVDVRLPLKDIERSVVRIPKSKRTPAHYPRDPSQRL